MFENSLIKVMISWINGVLQNLSSGFAKNTFYFDNPVTLAEMKSLYAQSVGMSYTIATLAMIYCIIVWLISFDLEEVRTAKKKIGEIIFMSLFLKTSQYFFDFVHGFFNALTKTWSVGNSGGGGDKVGIILSALGISGGSTLPLVANTLGLVVIGILAVVTLFIMILLLNHSIIMTILKILTVLYPLALGASLADPCKPILKKITTLYIGLGLLAPIQMLTLNIATKTMVSGGLTFASTINMLGSLIVVVILVPSVLLYVVVTSAGIAKID